LSTVDIAIEHDLDALRDAWRRLAAETDSVFATWEWATVWWRHFGRGQPIVATVRIDGEVRGIVPLYVWRTRPLRIVRFIGHGPADRLGPICAPADRPLMATAKGGILAEVAPWDIFLADVLPAFLGWSDEQGGVLLLTESSPLMELDGVSWTTFLSRRGHHFRAHLRRRERKLDAAGRVNIRGTTSIETLPGDLDILYRLHRTRHGPATEFSRLESFHREFAAVAMQNGWLRLWILELDDEPVAAWHGFRYGSAYHNYQGGRDPSLAHLELGTVLIVHTIQQAISEHADTYHFLRGGEQYKFHFAERDEELATVGISRTFAGALSLGSYQLAHRLARQLRRRGRPKPG
jgi:CelD/BcsL family acetyltransferase involved in cellulose biosynthesis